VAGFQAGGPLAAVSKPALPDVMPISRAEGTYAMGVAVFRVPLGAIAGRVAGVIRAVRRR